jgi:hypothetical protein
MARGRMISKTLGTASRRFARLEVDYPTLGAFPQALYMLLVANADDAGRMDGDAYTVKHSMWSTSLRDESTFTQALDALAAVGLIQRYQVAGETIIQIVRFADHQTFKYTAKSKYPENPNDSDVLGKSGGIAPDSPLREEKVREEKVREGARADDPEHAQRFEQFWQRYPKQQGRSAAWDAWQLIRPTAEHAAGIMAGLDRWIASTQWQEAIAAGELQYIKGAGKWLSEAAWDELQSAPPGGYTRCWHDDPKCQDEATCTRRELDLQRQGPHRPADVVPIRKAGTR